MKSIKLLTTGGTIAKRYNELKGELIFDKELMEKMLSQARCMAHIDIVPVMHKDSLEMNDRDREAILSAAKQCNSDQIVITHGTDTMVETALKLIPIEGKTIVFTGAMIPFAFKNSDALFNLASAVTAVQTLPYGVYIAMNGQIFHAENVRKNREVGIFETLR